MHQLSTCLPSFNFLGLTVLVQKGWKTWKRGGFYEKCNKHLNIEKTVCKKSIYALRMITSDIALHNFLKYIQLNLSSSLCSRKDWQNHVRIIKPCIIRNHMLLKLQIWFVRSNTKGIDYVLDIKQTLIPDMIGILSHPVGADIWPLGCCKLAADSYYVFLHCAVILTPCSFWM